MPFGIILDSAFGFAGIPAAIAKFVNGRWELYLVSAPASYLTVLISSK